MGSRPGVKRDQKDYTEVYKRRKRHPPAPRRARDGPASGSSALRPHSPLRIRAISAYSDGQCPPRLLLILLCLC